MLCTLPSHRTKFTPRARPLVFLGCPQEMKGYKLYDIQQRVFFISRDVVFNEGVFPFLGDSSITTEPDPCPQLVLPQVADFQFASSASFSNYTYCITSH